MTADGPTLHYRDTNHIIRSQNNPKLYELLNGEIVQLHTTYNIQGIYHKLIQVHNVQ